MRTNVTFRHPAEFVQDAEGGEDVLHINGARWFAELLTRVPDLEIDRELCQEDWGVVLFACRNRKQFWIGLSAWNLKGYWLAHVHHGSFAWLQRFSSTGKSEFKSLLDEIHRVLVSEPAISDVVWYEESEIMKPDPKGFPAPMSD